ncbi:T-complex protein 11-domain-containing protein, partial [Dichotomocladium elegans]
MSRRWVEDEAAAAGAPSTPPPNQKQPSTAKISLQPAASRKANRTDTAVAAAAAAAAAPTRQESFCKDPICWAGITHQHRVLTRNSLRRQTLSSRHSYKTRRRRPHHIHWHPVIMNKQRQSEQHIATLVDPTIASPTRWTPPITADTLSELSHDRITANLQLRHDLVFDSHLKFRPNLDGHTGKLKQKRTEQYWLRLEEAFEAAAASSATYGTYTVLLPCLIHPLVECLELLLGDRGHVPATATTVITVDTVRHVLDPARILREIQLGQLDLRSKVDFVLSVLRPMCPTEQWPRLQLLSMYFSQRMYAKGFRQCFAIVEAIQLERANRYLKHHRHTLIQTCARHERRRFSGPVEPIIAWLKASHTHPDMSFKQVFYTAIVRLIVHGCEGVADFPATLKYDRDRLTCQFRNEFHSILSLAILSIPYHYLSGKPWDALDIQEFKVRLSWCLRQQQELRVRRSSNSKGSDRHLPISVPSLTTDYYGLLAMHVHEAAAAEKAASDRIRCRDQVAFWTGWLGSHLQQPRSLIYQMIHARVVRALLSQLLEN